MLRLTLLCSLTLFASIASGQQSEIDHTRRERERELMRKHQEEARQAYFEKFGDRHPQPYRSYYSLNLVDAITEAERDWYADLLRLSDAQRGYLNHLYSEYRRDEKALRDSEISDLWKLSAEIKDTYESSDPQIGEGMERLWDARSKVVQQVNAIERVLFNRLIEMLADEQVVHLEHVKRLRRRMHANAWPTLAPAAMIDLEQILRQLHDEGKDLTPTDAAAFDAAIHEYSLAATLLFERRTELQERTSADQSRAMAESRTLAARDDPALQARAKEKWEEAERMRESLHAITERIHELNRSYTARLAALLSVDAGRGLRDRFHAQAYPVVFPNPYAVNKVFDKLVTIESLSAVQRETIDALAARTNEQASETSESMRVRYVEWRTQRLLASGYNLTALGEYQVAMRELQATRQAIATRALDELAALLPPDQLAMIKAPIADVRARIEKDARAADGASPTDLRHWPGL